MQHTTAIILAGGKGTRVQAPADQNKVVFALNNRPMVAYSVENVLGSGIETVVVVVGHAKESVKSVLGDSVTYADQGEPLGTGHALAAGFKQVAPETTTILSMYGDDSAFYTPDLIKQLIQLHNQTGSAITFLTVEAPNPTGLGRIVRDEWDQVQSIVEEKNASPEQKLITEVNTGLYCFKRKFLETYLSDIPINPVSGEYYLTDLVEIARKNNIAVVGLKTHNYVCWFGVNTKEELQKANELMKARFENNQTPD
jgi:bifunctional UDP-N-acetylglucosamine pyrophosphorylase/glucosamine-1-phosphate N-acetyltransferase